MSDRGLKREIARAYIDGVKEDPLLGLVDIRNYSEPNFIDNNGRHYLVRCFQCPGREEHGKGNYGPNVASGRCTWCEWEPSTEVLAYIRAKMVLAELPPKRGMTIEEIKKRYPGQYQEALSQYRPENQEDDGEID